MPTTDRSQTERIRRMRAQIQAVRRAECFTCLEEGPQGPVDESTRVSRKFGQSIYYKQNASGQVTPTGCCGPSSSGDPNTIIFTSCNQFMFNTFQAGQIYTFINNTGSNIVFITLPAIYETINAETILLVGTSKSLPSNSSGTIAQQVFCMFNLSTGSGTVSQPNLVGYNNTGGSLTVTRNGGSPQLINAGVAIGPFAVGDTWTAV